MAQENVVVVRFTEPSKAYQALSVLKDADATGRIGLQSAAVVERTPEGELRIPEGTDNVGLIGTASGSLARQPGRWQVRRPVLLAHEPAERDDDEQPGRLGQRSRRLEVGVAGAARVPSKAPLVRSRFQASAVERQR
jgi:hypothetical protein